MTESEIRKKVIETAKSYLGVKEGSKEHKHIVSVFNTVKPDGGAMTVFAPWCACYVSAVEIEALGKSNAKKICPLSYNCGTIISKAKKMGIWIESDSYKPKEADWILYDWDDNGKGDDKGSPEHVGLVEKVTSKQITVIEGNKHDRCERRVIKINGRFIRGFVAIPYKQIATSQTTVVSKPSKDKTLRVGSKVRIRKGANQYGTSKAFAPFVYDRIYKVIEIIGNRAVFADNGTVIGAVRKNDCIVQ